MAEPSDKPPYILRRPGGEIDRNRVFNAPGVVLLIVAATVVIYFLMALSPQRAIQIIDAAAAVSPQRFLAGPEANGGVLNMVSPLVAHMFVHAGLAHLAVNMMFLLAFGSPTARRMGADNALGSIAGFSAAAYFLIFYFLSGAAGALAYIGLHADENSLLIGASGGVSGLLGGLVRFAFNRTSLFGPERARISPLSSSGVLIWSAAIVGMNLVAALFSEPLTGGAAIAWEAHLGGYFFGLFTYPFFERIARAGP